MRQIVVMQKNKKMNLSSTQEELLSETLKKIDIVICTTRYQVKKHL